MDDKELYEIFQTKCLNWVYLSFSSDTKDRDEYLRELFNWVVEHSDNLKDKQLKELITENRILNIRIKKLMKEHKRYNFNFKLLKEIIDKIEIKHLQKEGNKINNSGKNNGNSSSSNNNSSSDSSNNSSPNEKGIIVFKPTEKEKGRRKTKSFFCDYCGRRCSNESEHKKSDMHLNNIS